MLSSRMRRVSGEWRRLWARRRRSSDGDSVRARGGARRSHRRLNDAQDDRRDPRSRVAISVSDAIKRFDLLELAVDLAELAAYPLDVTVDRAVVDVDRFAVRGIHQLVAVLHVAGSFGERLQEKELGHREVHLL